ncbi:hypothetical protein ACHAWF_012572 [Thalassiosira exigua]
MEKYQYNLDVLPSGRTAIYFSGADLVIEAIFENLELNCAIIWQVEGVRPGHCVFTTNTSAIYIADIAALSLDVLCPQIKTIVIQHFFFRCSLFVFDFAIRHDCLTVEGPVLPQFKARPKARGLIVV